MTFAIQFSEPVSVTGSVNLEVALSSGNKSLALSSGSGTDTLNFTMPILANDEQCNGVVVFTGVDLGAGTVESLATGDPASFLDLPTEVLAQQIDTTAPFFGFPVDILIFDAEFTFSPLFSGADFRGADNCTLTLLEGGIGTSPGATDVTAFGAIPPGSSYRIEDGVDGFSVNITPSIDHFVNLRAFDEAGNLSCLLYTSPSPRDRTRSRMPSSA